MIRSDVFVTDFAALDLPRLRVSELERTVSRACFEALFADRDSFWFFIITRSFGTSQKAIGHRRISCSTFKIQASVQ